MTMPTPPASLTARLLLTRSLVPRTQVTILPLTLAGSSTGTPPFQLVLKHSWAALGSAPATAASSERMIGVPAGSGLMFSEAPL